MATGFWPKDDDDDLLGWADSLKTPATTVASATPKRIQAPKEDDKAFRGFFEKRGFRVNRTFGKAINKGSLHPYGLAADVAIHGKSDDDIGELVEEALSRGYRLFDERQKQPGVKQTGPHLHFERNNGEKPSTFLDGRYGKRRLDYLRQLDQARLGKAVQPNGEMAIDENSIWADIDGLLAPKAPAEEASVWKEVDNVLGVPPSPAQTPIPESLATLEAQLTSVRDANSPKAGVLLTDAAQERLFPSSALTGLKRVERPEGILYVNPTKAPDFEKRSIAELIGKVDDVSDTSKGTALVTADASGNELSSSIVKTPESLSKQAAIDAASFPQATKQEVTNAQDVVEKRKEQLAPADPLIETLGGLTQIAEANQPAKPAEAEKPAKETKRDRTAAYNDYLAHATAQQIKPMPRAEFEEKTGTATPTDETPEELRKRQIEVLGHPIETLGGVEMVPNAPAAPSEESPYRKLISDVEAKNRLSGGGIDAQYQQFLDSQGWKDSAEMREAFNTAKKAEIDQLNAENRKATARTAVGKPVGKESLPTEGQPQAPATPDGELPKRIDPTKFSIPLSGKPANRTYKQFVEEEVASRLASQLNVPYDVVKNVLDQYPIEFAGKNGGKVGENYIEGQAKAGYAHRIGIGPDVIERIHKTEEERTAKLKQYDQELLNEANKDANPKIQQLNALIRSGMIDAEKGQQLIADERAAFGAATKGDRIIAGARRTQGETSPEQLYSPEQIDAIIKEHGGFAEKVARDQRIEKEYGTTFDSSRPLARPSEAIVNMGRYIAGIGSTALNTIGMGVDAMSPAGLPDNPFNEAADYWTERLEKSKNPDFKGEVLTDMLPTALAQLGVQTIGAVFTGGLSLGLPLAEGAISQYNEARKAGAGQNVRLLAGGVGGVAAVPGILLHAKYLKNLFPAQQQQFINKLTQTMFGRLSKFLPEAEARAATQSFVGSFLRKVPLGTAVEPAQEGIEDVTNKAFKKIAYDPTVTWTDVFVPSEQEKKGYLVASIVGTVGGNIEVITERMSTAELAKAPSAIEQAIKDGLTTETEAAEIRQAVDKELEKRGLVAPQLRDKTGKTYDVVKDEGKIVQVQEIKPDGTKGSITRQNQRRFENIDDYRKSNEITPMPTPEQISPPVAESLPVQTDVAESEAPKVAQTPAPVTSTSSEAVTPVDVTETTEPDLTVETPQTAVPEIKQPERRNLAQRPAAYTVPRKFGATDRRAGIGKKVVELEQEVQVERRRANTNPLTGLGSKNAWEAAQENIESDPKQSVISLDVNRMKDANDTTSHSNVDKVVLAPLGKAIQKVLKKHSIDTRNAFTPGGDEAYVAAPNDLSEQIRDEIEAEFGTVDIVAEKDYTNSRTGESFKKGDVIPITLSGTFGQNVSEAEKTLGTRKEESKAKSPVRRAASDLDAPAPGMIDTTVGERAKIQGAIATERKKRAFVEVKRLRSKLKNATARQNKASIRVDLLEAEGRYKEALRAEQSAKAELKPKPIPASKPKSVRSLSQFVRSMGGIRATKVDVGEHRRISNKETGTTGLINKNSKYTASEMAEAAWEHGYLRDEWSDISEVDGNRLMQLIEDDFTGVKPAFSRESEEVRFDDAYYQRLEEEYARNKADQEQAWEEYAKEQDDLLAVQGAFLSAPDAQEILAKVSEEGQYKVTDAISRLPQNEITRQYQDLLERHGIDDTHADALLEAYREAQKESESTTDRDIDGVESQRDNAEKQETPVEITPSRAPATAFDQVDLFGNKQTPKTEQTAMFDMGEGTDISPDAEIAKVQKTIDSFASRAGHGALVSTAKEALKVFALARKTRTSTEDMLRQQNLDKTTVADDLGPLATKLLKAMDAGTFDTVMATESMKGGSVESPSRKSKGFDYDKPVFVGIYEREAPYSGKISKTGRISFGQNTPSRDLFDLNASGRFTPSAEMKDLGIDTSPGGGSMFLSVDPDKLKEAVAFLQNKGFKALQVPTDAIESDHAYLTKQFGDKAEETLRMAASAPARAEVSSLGFFSQVEQTLLDKMPNKASAAQIKGILKDAKKEELAWLDLDSFLATKETFSKDEILEFVRSNNVVVEEVVKGNRKPKVIERDGKFGVQLADGSIQKSELGEQWFNEKIFAEQALTNVLRYDPASVSETKFSSYTLPGGENYKELLLVMPDLTFEHPVRVFNKATNQTVERFAGGRAAERYIKQRDPQFLELDYEDDGGKGDVYRSPHFSEPNVLAHVRFDTRDGGKTLHVAELQSDWGQAGRAKGFRGQYRAGEQVPVAGGKPATIIDPVPDSEGNVLLRFADGTEGRSPAKYLDDAKVPTMPFPKSWHEFAFKNILRHATENGFERVTWDTGTTQAERYDLSKQIDYIDWSRGPSGKFLIKAVKEGKALVEKSDQSPEALADLIGKDATDRILEQSKTKGYGILEGDDLKIQPTGMKGFYDKILVDFANKYTKKWGGKVEVGSLSTTDVRNRQLIVYPLGRGWGLVNSGTGEWLETGYQSEELARKRLKALYEERRPVNVHSLAITPAMKESVAAGQSLFRKGDITPEMAGVEGAELGDLYPRVDTAIDNGVLHINNVETYEIVRRILEDYSGKKEGAFFGLTLRPDEIAHAKKILKKEIDSIEDLGYTKAEKDGLRRLHNAFVKAANVNKHVLGKDVIPVALTKNVIDDMIASQASSEERAHAFLFAKAVSDRISEQQSEAWRKKILASGRFKNARDFQKDYADATDAVKVHEFITKLASGQFAYLGFDPNVDKAEIEAILFDWANDFETVNGKIDFTEFAKINETTQYFIERYSESGRKGVESTRGHTQDKPPADQRGREEREDVPSGAEKQPGQKEAAFSRILGTPTYYDPQSHEETEAKAAQLLSDKGTRQAVWEALNGRPGAETMRVVYWELERLNGLADVYLESGDIAAYNAVANEIADLSSQIVTRQVRNGQETEIAKTLAPLSPEVAILTATRMKKFATGDPDAQLTDRESKQVIEIAKNLKDANKKLAEKELALKKAERKIKRLESDREPRRRTTQQKLLKEYKAKEPEILARLAAMFPDSPMFNGKEAAKDETLRMAAPKTLDPDQQELLTQYTVGQILQGKPYGAVIAELNDLGGDSQVIHAMAVHRIKNAEAPKTQAEKAALAIRNKHYKEAEKLLVNNPQLLPQGVEEPSGITLDAIEDGETDPEIIFAIDRITGEKPKNITQVVKDIREKFNRDINEATKKARQANQIVGKIRSKRRAEADEARKITPELRKELSKERVAKARATYKLNKFLNQLSDRPWLMERFNNDFRAKLVSNWATQLFNAVQGVGSTAVESVIDLVEAAIKTFANPNPEATVDINAKDVWLPLSYVFSSNKQIAEQALAEFPEEYYKVHSGLLGDIEIEPRKLADTSALATKPFHLWFDRNEELNKWLSKVSGAKMQEMHFRNAIVASTFDQIIRKKSGGKETLKTAIEGGTLTKYITESDASVAAAKALRVTFAAMIDDPVGKVLKRGYDQIDKVLPVLLNPVTYARFTYTTSKVMVANPLLLGALDSKTLGGQGYTARSAAKGVLGWAGVAMAYGLLSAFGDDDDRWETININGTTLDIRRFFPFSAYFYVAHLIKSQVEGAPPPTGKELLEGFASLETDYFQYGAGMELGGKVKDFALGKSEAGDVGASTARLLGSYFSGLLRFFKPMKDALAQFDKEESKLRDFSDSGKDKFIKEMSRSIPFIGRLTPVQKDALTGEDVEGQLPLGRAVGINIVHPSFLSSKESTATKWANRLFEYVPTDEWTADERRAYYTRRRLLNAVRRKEVDLKDVRVRIEDLVREDRLTRKSGERLKDDLKLSELAYKLKYAYRPGKENRNKVMDKRLAKVLRYATPEEKAEIEKAVGKRMEKVRQ